MNASMENVHEPSEDLTYLHDTMRGSPTRAEVPDLERLHAGYVALIGELAQPFPPNEENS